MAAGSKYSIIIEALIDTKSLKTSLETQQKSLELILNNVTISQEGMANLKKQLETGLSNINVNVNADKTKAVGKEISDNIAAGIQQSGTTGKVIANNFESANLAIAKANKQIELMQTQSPKAFQTERVQNFVNTVKSLQPTLLNNEVSLKQFNGAVSLMNKEFQTAKAGMEGNVTGLSKFTSQLNLALGKIALWAVGTTVFYGTIKQLQDMKQYVIDLNKAMTDIQIVNNMNSESISQLASQYNSLAKEMGVTTLEVAKGSIEWVRQGKNVTETTELLKASLLMSKLANMDSAQATEYLTSIVNGFKLEVKDVIPTIDKLVSLDNAFATSVSEISAAMQRTSNVAQQEGVTFDQLAGYIK